MSRYGAGYGGYGVVSGEYAAILPDEGERLIFGVHRLPVDERECEMWPRKVNPFAKSKTLAWMKGGLKGNPEAVMLLARVKSGQQPIGPGERYFSPVIRIVNSRPVTWVTQAEREAALERLRDDWYNNRITATEAEEARRRLDAA